jgi:L-ascorbate metabolism protein UlaG (beta-lactamase superfamily)
MSRVPTPPAPGEAAPEPSALELPGDVPGREMRVRWLGHATTEIVVDGVRLLTDPLLVDSMAPMVRRRAPEPALIDPADPIHAVLISHAHQDHLHIPSLRLLPAGTKLIVPAGLGRWLARRGFEHVEEMTPGRETWVGGVRVRATRAAHGGRRLPLGPDAPALGYVVEGNDGGVYFAGDTEIFEEMAEIPRGLDTALAAALLPVGGWGPTLRGGHMDAARAAQALRLLDPAHAIPIHWGTYWPRGLGRVRPARFHSPGAAFQLAATEAHPAVRVHLLRPGEARGLAR